MIRAGFLRHRIEIQAESQAVDSAGEPRPGWSTEATVWASVEPLVGRELIVAQQIKAETSHKVTMRHRSLNERNRILFKGRVLAITSIINPEERNKLLMVYAQERKP